MSRILTGRLVLLVEDEPLIALELAQAFERAGARVMTARTRQEALRLVQSDGLSAAVLDHVLGDGDSSQLYALLKNRCIPFVLYSGFSQIEGDCHDVPLVAKPSAPQVLVSKVEDLLRARSSPNSSTSTGTDGGRQSHTE